MKPRGRAEPRVPIARHPRLEPASRLRSMSRPPLDGIRVVDLTSYNAGSYSAMMLAGLGAEVVKVESLAGDSFRELPGFFGWNRGKHSIAVDLKAPDGRAVVERLAARGDVVMENMRPGVADRLGVGWSQLRSEEHTSELQSLRHLVCRLLLEKKNKQKSK